MNKFKLTTLSKVLIFVVLAAAVLIPAYFLGAFDGLLSKAAKVSGEGTVASSDAKNSENGSVGSASDSNPMKISLDEWIGWKPIIDANGGLKTAKGSIYDKLGLDLEISIINDATQSSSAVINNSLNGAGYTINRYAFLYPKFIENNTPVKMVYITNFSNGGDGIIAKNTIASVEGLVGKKIGVPRYSEAQTLVEWLLSKSSLTDEQVKKIRQDMVMFDTPDDAAKAFFAGKVDAAGTWQPYLSQAQETTGAKLLFSTKAATNLILDGIIFREDYIAANSDKVQLFIEGSLQAIALYTTEFTAIKDSMPLFSTETNDSIKSMTGDAALSDYSANQNLFNGTAQTLFTDMSSIWKSLGEKSKAESVNDAFDASILTKLADKFEKTEVATPKFTEKQRNTAKADNSALLTQRLSVQFETNQATIKEESYAELKKFADTAKLLNGVIIQIEGNTDSAGDPNTNKTLSEKRAKAVATYLQYQDIDPTRFIIIGNGEDKPISDNNSEAGKAENRRTDAFFKVVN